MTSRRSDHADAAAAVLGNAGYEVSVATVDASSREVDLYGTALVLEAFGNVIARGGSGVVISSQLGHRLPPLTAEQNRALAMTPTDELLGLAFLQPDRLTDSLHAYQLSKRGNSLRVMAEAVRWGKRRFLPVRRLARRRLSTGGMETGNVTAGWDAARL